MTALKTIDELMEGREKGEVTLVSDRGNRFTPQFCFNGWWWGVQTLPKVTHVREEEQDVVSFPGCTEHWKVAKIKEKSK